MHELNILFTLVAGLAVALVFGYIAKRLSISPIVGYLLAGIAIGPFTPGIVADQKITEQFAEIGVILLLFIVGLRFQVKELIAVWRTALPGALLQSTVSTLVTAGIMHLFGWSLASGLILGMAISVASTVVMSMVLSSHRDMHTPIGHIAIGWTVVEDIITVILMLLLPVIFGKQHVSFAGTGISVLIAFAKLAALGTAVFVLGQWVIPWLLERIERTRSRELFTLSVLVIALGIAASAATFFGISMALGAFLAGIAVGRSDFASRAAGDALPMKDAFSILFFVSIGMLVDPRAFMHSPLIMLAILGVVIVVKPITAMLVVRLLGKPFPSAIPIGAAFAQVGEFSFILGTVARSLGVLNDAGWNALVGASIVSIAANPFVYSLARRTAARINRSGGISPPPKSPRIDEKKCIIVGYGPVGRIVHNLLAEQNAVITIIDLNIDTVRALKARGYRAIYGDVLRQGILEEAGIAEAGTLVLSADIEDATEIIRQASQHNPKIRTFVRCSNLRDAIALKNAGASVVAAGEAEVGVAIAEAVSQTGNMDAAAEVKKRTALRSSLYEFAEARGSHAPSDITVVDRLSSANVLSSVHAKTKDEALLEIVDAFAPHAKIKDKGEFFKRVLEREGIANTGIGMGIAIPHVRSNLIGGLMVGIAVSKAGIAWGSVDGKPVHVICMLGANESQNDAYLKLLSRIAALLNDAELLRKMRECPDADGILSLLRDREQQLTGKR